MEEVPAAHSKAAESTVQPQGEGSCPSPARLGQSPQPGAVIILPEDPGEDGFQAWTSRKQGLHARITEVKTGALRSMPQRPSLGAADTRRCALTTACCFPASTGCTWNSDWSGKER